MVITELYLKNFGQFSERRFFLRDGIQVISGENESGKSTLHAFIRAMLFGLERGRGKAAAKDDFTRYEPWDNPGNYAGVMRFECGGRNFRLERNFDRYTKKAVLVCEDDGEELSVEKGDLSMLLGGITASGFDSTVSVRQLMAMPGQELADSLKNYAANYYETGSETMDLSTALQILREKKKDALRQLRAAERKSEESRKAIAQECRYLEQDMERLQAEFEEKKAGLCSDYDDDCEEDKSKRKEEGKSGIERGGLIKGGITGIIIGAAGTAWGTFLGTQNLLGSSVPFLFISVLILIAGAVLLIAGLGTAGQEKISEGEERNPKDDAVNAVRKMKWETERIQAEYKEKLIRLENLREDYTEGDSDEMELRCRETAEVFEMAEENLKAASEDLGRETSRLLDRKASEIFSELTGGKYISLNVGGKMDVSVWNGIRRVPAEALSRGTLEQIYFSIRMAAAAILQEEPMPVILDDTFAFYDDVRLESALKWLRGQERQVIILSCQKREEEILKDLK